MALRALLAIHKLLYPVRFVLQPVHFRMAIQGVITYPAIREEYDPMALSKYNEDYLAMRPGTPGGEDALQTFKRQITPPSFPSPTRIHSKPDVKAQPKPHVEAPPRQPWKMTKADLLVAAVVFLIASLILWRGYKMDGWGAISLGFLASGIAARLWKALLTLGIAGTAIWFFFLRH
jgi:hypothetical protein